MNEMFKMAGMELPEYLGKDNRQGDDIKDDGSVVSETKEEDLSKVEA